MKIFASSVLATVLSGCATHTAQVARDLTRGDVQVRVESVSIGRDTGAETRVELTVLDVPSGTKLRGAALKVHRRPSLAPLCSESPAAKLGRSSLHDASAPLAPNEHLTLGLTGLSEDTLTDENPYLEILLETPGGTRRCVALPLTDAPRRLDWRANQRVTVGLDFGVEMYEPGLGPVTQVGMMQAQIGAWIGRFHLEASGGIASAGCPDTRCAAPQDHVNNSRAWPVSLGARTPLWEGEKGSSGSGSIGVGLRYRAIQVAADTFQGREEFWLHGPVLVPYFGGGPRKNGPLGGSQEGMFTLEVPIGYAFAEGGRRSFSLGFDLTGFLTVL